MFSMALLVSQISDADAFLWILYVNAETLDVNVRLQADDSKSLKR